MKAILCTLLYLVIICNLRNCYGLPITNEYEDEGMNTRRARSLMGQICPPGTTSEGCFLNKLYLVLGFQGPQPTDTRSIGKRSLESDMTVASGDNLSGFGNFVDNDGANLMQYLEMVSDTDGHEPRAFINDNAFGNDANTHLGYRETKVEPSLMPYENVFTSEVGPHNNKIEPDDVLVEYILQTINPRNVDDSLGYNIVNKRDQQPLSNLHKRQFSCGGDKFQCFLKNLQYLLDIQKTMTV